MKNTLSIYGSHDASAVFIDKNNQLKVLEYERFVKKRYAMYSERFDRRINGIGTCQEQRHAFIQYIKSQLDDTIDYIIYNELSPKDLDYLAHEFPNADFEQAAHHKSHAASGFYSSGFKDAIIFSVDGGGRDHGVLATTKIFQAKDDKISLLEMPDLDFGGAYSQIGCPISEIIPGPDSNHHSLSYAGKVMGLCAYGHVQTNWLPAIEKYYQHRNLDILGNDIGVDLNFNAVSGQISYDLAATSQYVFEKLLLNIINPYIEQNDNFIMVGGCALNVLFNQKLKTILDSKNKNLYVPSNPNDCGLGLGQFLQKYPNINTNVYSGFDILDKSQLNDYIQSRNAVQITTEEIVNLIKAGNIIGMVSGCSEVGPRALGNRSIICDPSINGMKDILNAKVKFREWFRPFAPVCRLEDKDRFFDEAYETEFMSYTPNVKKKLKAICHTDNTARLQTVSEHQHVLFYKILTELANRSEIPVILNTSFNIKGMPILTTIEDALYCLDNTQMDYVIVEGWLFERKS